MVFIFSPSYPSILGDQKWKLFITDVYNELQIEIDGIVLESIIIQYIYKYYLLFTIKRKKDVVPYKEVIPIENSSYWKVCTLEYSGIKYLYHKDTKYVFLNENCYIVWKGIFDETKKIIVERHSITNNKDIEDWLNKCGIK
jgi:hypothetical protein